ncbi:helix-turn-helix transcriptional regulator [Planococcus sp. CAU13]|uniref:helix-turn-helix transcriptional regulator n=1 Tax=Planococcus sp. CAU13 TaxID=1541197 RepID=UPI00052FF9A6|nr:helix-turn-helix transcriptional regulator [Planococcus sp. CAU13]
MKIIVLSQNDLEAQGLKWLIESHMNGVEVSFSKEDAADCLVIDMDLWNEELNKEFSKRNIPWIGLSSDRTFLTAYRALKGKATDLLFRPFDPLLLVKQLQQIRFQLRNERKGQGNMERTYLRYEDFFDADVLTPEITLAAFVLPDKAGYPFLSKQLKKYPFHKGAEIFAFSDFVLAAFLTVDEQSCIEESRMFHESWKRETREDLSIFVNANRRAKLKDYYQDTRDMTSLIFYEGYDISVIEHEPMAWLPVDPFLTPVEQRQWIEMLENKDTRAIHAWMQNEFLSYSRPYPDPEMIRVRLTSVLAQARRYMKSVHLVDGQWEKSYHEIFEIIVKDPVVYRIAQSTLNFIVNLVSAAVQKTEKGESAASEQIRALMEANYWNPDWNLSACAEQLQMNKSTLSRRFQKQNGRKFSEQLMHIRIREAKRLMKETDISLDEVARLSGFGTASYFSSVYKKYENLTPSQYRQGELQFSK